MQCRVLGDINTAQVFRLAGLHSEVAEDAATARAKFNELLKEEDLGLLIVTEKIAGFIGEAVMGEIETSRHFPLILTIPGREGHIEGAEDIIEKVQKFIGIKV